MKTYKDFKIFINSPEYCNVVWGYVKGKALEQGFKSWQFTLYQWWYLRKFHCRGIRIFIRKTLKYLWYIFVFVGLGAFGWDLHNLIKSTTRKNDVVTLSYVAHTCTEYPNLCERIADKGGYVLKKRKVKMETLNYVASPLEHPGLVVAGGESEGQVRRILIQQGKDPQNYRIWKLEYNPKG